MKVKLLLPYNQYDDDDFNSSYNMSNDEFFSRLEKEESVSQNIAYDYVNMDRSRYRNAASFNQGVSQRDARLRFSSSQAVLKHDGGAELTIDELVDECVNQDVGALIIEIDLDSIEEEFESELKMWLDEHDSINSYESKLGEDWVFEHEPSKNIKVEYLNKANEVQYCDMINCRIVERVNASTFAVVYDKIIFSKKDE